MDEEEFKHKRSETGNAFSGHGLYSGEVGSKTKAGVRGVYYYNGNPKENATPIHVNSEGIKKSEDMFQNLYESVDPFVRTCKSDVGTKRLVN